MAGLWLMIVCTTIPSIKILPWYWHFWSKKCYLSRFPSASIPAGTVENVCSFQTSALRMDFCVSRTGSNIRNLTIEIRFLYKWTISQEHLRNSQCSLRFGVKKGCWSLPIKLHPFHIRKHMCWLAGIVYGLVRATMHFPIYRARTVYEQWSFFFYRKHWTDS